MLNRSPSTLRKYIFEQVPDLQPSKTVMFGRVGVYLYTREDIARMTKVLEQRLAVRDYMIGGRPSKFTPEERKDRARLFSRRHYWRKMLDRAIFFEDEERVKEVNEEIALIDKELAKSDK